MNPLPVDRLLTWYHSNKRVLPWRKSPSQYQDIYHIYNIYHIYHIWVSEVMLQQTQVTTVIPFYNRFIQRFPDIAQLARASEEEVLKLWEGLGYYSRARNFHQAARQVMERHNGIIPTTPTTFSSLPGVGPYIAAAVLSIACNIPLPAVDGNVMRVYTRFQAIKDDIRKNSTKNLVRTELKSIIPANAAGDFTQALMELGALICIPKKPLCPKCPFQLQCKAFNTHSIEQFPVKSAMAKIPEYNVSIGIIEKDNRVYIQKRPSTGHLGGLWEFPGGKARPGETPSQTLLRECLEELKTEIEIIEKLTLIHHAYTHFKIHMTVFRCHLKSNTQPIIHPPQNTPSRWITLDQLDLYPFPTANHKFFPLLKQKAFHEPD